tara:strand:- start:47 stop:388 length:342 start_codon:yes stop_codon:yes gene_type:complete
MSDEELSDEEVNMNMINEEIIDDSLVFVKDYEKLKKHNITQPYLTKFEKTKVVSERAQQLSNGSKSLLKNPSDYDSVYEIALEELKQKKIPFIIRRPVSNGYEYWKLEDLRIL